jgi:membrane-bound ClpP family serine protease
VAAPFPDAPIYVIDSAVSDASANSKARPGPRFTIVDTPKDTKPGAGAQLVRLSFNNKQDINTFLKQLNEAAKDDGTNTDIAEFIAEEVEKESKKALDEHVQHSKESLGNLTIKTVEMVIDAMKKKNHFTPEQKDVFTMLVNDVEDVISLYKADPNE